MFHFWPKRNEARNYSTDGGKKYAFKSKFSSKIMKICKSKSPCGQMFSIIFLNFPNLPKITIFLKSIEIDVQNDCTPGIHDFPVFLTGKTSKKATHEYIFYYCRLNSYEMLFQIHLNCVTQPINEKS